MIIKVCGMREAENIRAVEQAGADWMGFIFYPRSPRYVTQRPAYLPTRCRRVGVFVDASTEEILQKAAEFGLDFIQLHGHETPGQCRDLRSSEALRKSTSVVFRGICNPPAGAQKVAAQPVPADLQSAAKTSHYGIIKAFPIASEADLETTVPYEGCCDYYLFDTATPNFGGSGKTFDWSILQAYSGSTPFLLSGGLGPDSATALAEFHHPKWAGIDLNSGFETAPAVKDAALLHKFIEKTKKHDAMPPKMQKK